MFVILRVGGFNTDSSLDTRCILLGPNTSLHIGRVLWNGWSCLICAQEIHLVLVWRSTLALAMFHFRTVTTIHWLSLTSLDSTCELLVICMSNLLFVEKLGCQRPLTSKCLNFNIGILQSTFLDILGDSRALPLKWLTSYSFVVTLLLLLFLHFN